jgi:hypothetical protein
MLFWSTAPCGFAGRYKRFGITYRLHLHVRRRKQYVFSPKRWCLVLPISLHYVRGQQHHHHHHHRPDTLKSHIFCNNEFEFCNKWTWNLKDMEFRKKASSSYETLVGHEWILMSRSFFEGLWNVIIYSIYERKVVCESYCYSKRLFQNEFWNWANRTFWIARRDVRERNLSVRRYAAPVHAAEQGSEGYWSLLTVCAVCHGDIFRHDLSLCWKFLLV